MTPTQAATVYAPVEGARSLSLTSADAPGTFVRIWLNGGERVTSERVGNDGEATVFVMQGCDFVDDDPLDDVYPHCNPTAEDLDAGPATWQLYNGNPPTWVQGHAIWGTIEFTVTFEPYGEVKVGFECDFYSKSEWCGTVAYRSARVSAYVASRRLAMPHTLFTGEGRVYLNNESSLYWSAN